MIMSDNPVAARLAEWPRARLTMNELSRMLIDATPDIATAVDRRQRERAAVDQLAADGKITLPTSRSAWDVSVRPGLPRTMGVVRQRPATKSRAGNALRAAWNPRLSWAAAEQLSSSAIEALLTVNRWLRDVDTLEPVVPLRERSLDIFGDEKRLDALIKTKLFGAQRLTLDLLRCEVVNVPFVFQQISDAPLALIVENHANYASFLRHLTHTRAMNIGHLIYGAGRHFEASVTYLSQLSTAPQTVRYFGDLDIAGLAIPAAASRRAVELGLPAVLPASGLYDALLDHGTPNRATAATSSSADEHVRWLDFRHQESVARLLTSGVRLAQEAVGTSLLTRQPQLLEDVE
jgi:hypothetical protein